MLGGLSDNFWGQPGGQEHGEPSCHCGAPQSEPLNLPEGDPRGPLAFRRCTGPDHHVVWLAHQPGAATAAREAVPC